MTQKGCLTVLLCIIGFFIYLGFCTIPSDNYVEQQKKIMTEGIQKLLPNKVAAYNYLSNKSIEYIDIYKNSPNQLGCYLKASGIAAEMANNLYIQIEKENPKEAVKLHKEKF